MKSSTIKLLSFIVALCLLTASSESVAQAQASTTIKSFDIQRYTNQPLQLIDLRIGDLSIKDKIAGKRIISDVFIDTVAFEASAGWFRKASFTFRNASGRPIYGVSADFYFKPDNSKTIYSLPLTASTPLKQGVIQPGGEVILTVTDQMWKLIDPILSSHGVDPDVVPVEFVLDKVRFTDDLMWQKGQMLQSEPGNPLKWNVIPGGV